MALQSQPAHHIAFDGRIYLTIGDGQTIGLQSTDLVLGRVSAVHQSSADAVYDLRLAEADGREDVLSGTEEHPFWVPSVQDYVALEDLEVGTVLRTYGGSEATVLGLSWKPGEVEVYDIEVEGLHNFFVRGPGSDAPGVLVHNSTGKPGTETVQRWMSQAELDATDATGLVRGGREGTHFVTDAANSSAQRARQRLALPQTPEVRVTMEVPEGAFSPPTRVDPAFGMPGGGMERTATGDIPATILRVDGKPK